MKVSELSGAALDWAVAKASGVQYHYSVTTGGEYNAEGPTPLVAAMRCYAASKLGEEIEVPKELT